MSLVPIPRGDPGRFVSRSDEAYKLLAAVLLQVGEVRITDETLYEMDRAQATTQGFTYYRNEPTRETVLRPYPSPEDAPRDKDREMWEPVYWDELKNRDLRIAELKWELVEARNREAAMYDEWHALHSRHGGLDQEEI